MDELDNEIFICMHCQKPFDITQGSFPQINFDGQYILNADLNDRTGDEFVCYDCIEKYDDNMNIIFTDIDGVLNPHFKKKWSKKAVEIYNKMCYDFNLKPVITSTWRIKHSIELLNKIFKEQGITVEIYDVTPLIDQADRGIEIKEWLDNNPCDKYVIIDDKTSNIDPHVPNAVKCRSWIGLTEEEYEEVKKIIS